MSELDITDLRVAVAGRHILDGISLTVRSGEVHAVMGPNGSGKSTLSHVVMGKPGYEIVAGSVSLDGADVLAMEPWQRAQAGLFLAMQYPTEVPGVYLDDMLTAAFEAADRGDRALAEARLVREAGAIGFDESFLHRPLNVDLSGGEKKRNETLQLGVLQPKFAVLDEIDSGLDVDALRVVSRRIEQETNQRRLGVLAITHYSRLLAELKPDVVHILVRGRIVETGGPGLAEQLEETGYAAWAPVENGGTEVGIRGHLHQQHPDPFADPLA